MFTSPRSLNALAAVGVVPACTRNRFVVFQFPNWELYPTARSNCTTMFTREEEPTAAISWKSAIPTSSRLLSASM